MTFSIALHEPEKVKAAAGVAAVPRKVWSSQGWEGWPKLLNPEQFPAADRAALPIFTTSKDEQNQPEFHGQGVMVVTGGINHAGTI
jgi:hypothetical protein